MLLVIVNTACAASTTTTPHDNPLMIDCAAENGTPWVIAWDYARYERHDVESHQPTLDAGDDNRITTRPQNPAV